MKCMKESFKFLYRIYSKSVAIKNVNIQYNSIVVLNILAVVAAVEACCNVNGVYTE